jgi:hypothetical protein
MSEPLPEHGAGGSPQRVRPMADREQEEKKLANDDRWTFLRDVVVFQLKLLVDNIRDFALMPISLGAALIDLIFKGKREGALFYRVLHWGAHSEKMIDVYSPIDREGTKDLNPNYTIDSVVARLEAVLVRECEKGGTAASIKAAMDRAIDQLHSETSGTRDSAAQLVTRAAGRFRGSEK